MLMSLVENMPYYCHVTEIPGDKFATILSPKYSDKKICPRIVTKLRQCHRFVTENMVTKYILQICHHFSV